MKAKVLNPSSKRKTVKRKKKISATRKRTLTKPVSKRKPVKRKVVRKINNPSPALKKLYRDTAKFLIKLENYADGYHEIIIEMKDRKFLEFAKDCLYDKFALKYPNDTFL